MSLNEMFLKTRRLVVQEDGWRMSKKCAAVPNRLNGTSEGQLRLPFEPFRLGTFTETDLKKIFDVREALRREEARSNMRFGDFIMD